MKAILVTGAAGFIGHALCKRLVADGMSVVGVDCMSSYYDVGLKEARLSDIGHDGFRFERLDLIDREPTAQLFDRVKPGVVVHLAAQPGVRYSLENPHAYVDANITAFLNVLEGARRVSARHLVFASSSSVYGGSEAVPFSVGDCVDHPVSLYAATKKANELMAHVYSHLHRLPSTGLRFFTVYGPWGRPDMAPMLFTKAILEGTPVRLFNDGQMSRDFTYIDDIVEGVVRVMHSPPTGGPLVRSNQPSASSAPYRIYNIGNSAPVSLLDFIETLERVLGRDARKVLAPMQPGDVPVTYADVSELERDCGFRPNTSLEVGLVRTAQWYREFYGV